MQAHFFRLEAGTSRVNEMSFLPSRSSQFNRGDTQYEGKFCMLREMGEVPHPAFQWVR